ncbi:hypothetical protein [Endozoicomonas sp. GU-1]|uniref:hypothetical protein n=1 Tax=Endozoicomonas sp. GU-1 TaxID=3009078 RepID=UPI0022B53B4A|nr:hypothetical protein [Endozoicomonas sp. GU-1]WBA79530.1 hypothetical protein O2T12_14190 [Endozoicomonas sp. GU-1]WBA87175.1 hypothetical protein O3276_03770 [Endozoicomonas sp. GU-1]
MNTGLGSNTLPTFNDTHTPPADAPPAYETTAKIVFLQGLKSLPRHIALVKAKEVIKELLDEYQINIGELVGGAGSGPHLSERSVSVPTRLSPIRQLMQADGNTDLLKGLNILVEGFNEEVSEFERIIDSKNHKEITAKAHGLTRIATQLNKRCFNPYDYRPNFIQSTLDVFKLVMTPSDFSRCSKAIYRLFESTGQCSKTEGPTDHQKKALTEFCDKLLTATAHENYAQQKDIVYGRKNYADQRDIKFIKEELGNGYYPESSSNTVANFCSTVLLFTRDVKVFRDTLDALFTLYEFTPSEAPLKEIPEDLNKTINEYATKADGFDSYRQ